MIKTFKFIKSISTFLTFYDEKAENTGHECGHFLWDSVYPTLIIFFKEVGDGEPGCKKGFCGRGCLPSAEILHFLLPNGRNTAAGLIFPGFDTVIPQKFLILPALVRRPAPATLSQPGIRA
ncbi:hypothetical protein ACQKLP_03930 [Chitinophaga sp. NPDC101104]|uniref:hypothetical protein n=1 Tax=Chitinophaga sp. NPDC101104 TaxID=3390561 RepID=UPI003CFDAFD1